MRAYEFQWPKTVTSDWLVHHVADLHDREDPYEGDVPERILQHSKWELKSIPVSDTDAEEYSTSPDLVADYAARDFASMPPIIFDKPAGQIIDGFHRSNAVLQAGIKQVLAYVPVVEINEEIDQDLQDVAEWLGTTADQLEVTKTVEPIDRFLNQIKEMYASYDEFPEDADRTNRIVQLIKGGEKPQPVYVEAGDPTLFVMEGRHRMVAFWLLGMKKIPVAYVSKKSENLTEAVPHFYHGSSTELPVGTVLTPRDDYENDWGSTDFYEPLERYRPTNMLAHKQSVFMCDNPDDVDLAGGATDWLFTVEPQGPVQRHDLNWGSEISMLIGDRYSIDSPEVKRAAENYWDGVPHEDESVWEYLTHAAKIIAVEPYE